MNIDDTITALINREGGYANDPADHGGETNFGISHDVAQAFGYVGQMRDMKRETAAEIYKKCYWLQPGFDKINEISPMIAEELLDTGVNMGPSIAGKFLQRALNVLNRQGKGALFQKLTVDGMIGEMTLRALELFLRVRGDAGRMVLLRMLNAQQSVKYIEIAENSPIQQVFEFGWQLNRVNEA